MNNHVPWHSHYKLQPQIWITFFSVKSLKSFAFRYGNQIRFLKIKVIKLYVRNVWEFDYLLWCSYTHWLNLSVIVIVRNYGAKRVSMFFLVRWIWYNINMDISGTILKDIEWLQSNRHTHLTFYSHNVAFNFLSDNQVYHYNKIQR